MDRKLVSTLLGISEKSYYRWKEERKIFKLLEKYFTNKDIQEFLETGKIQKFENLPDVDSMRFEIIQKLEKRGEIRGFDEDVIQAIVMLLRGDIRTDEKREIKFDGIVDLFEKKKDGPVMNKISIVDFVYIFSILKDEELELLFRF